MFGKRKRKDSSMVMVPRDDLLHLHWQVMRLSAAILDASGVVFRVTRDSSRLVPTEIVDAFGAVEGKFHQAVTTLDGMIPGGCPDGPR